MLEWVAIPFSGDLSDPRLESGSPALQRDSLPSEPRGKPVDTVAFSQRSVAQSPLLGLPVSRFTVSRSSRNVSVHGRKSSDLEIVSRQWYKDSSMTSLRVRTNLTWWLPDWWVWGERVVLWFLTQASWQEEAMPGLVWPDGNTMCGFSPSPTLYSGLPRSQLSPSRSLDVTVDHSSLMGRMS